jgi:L-threonylcarbamoyladenylate synthase
MTLHINQEAYERALHALISGKVIAYPTEAVYGLGCDPFNEDAVNKILQLKARPVEKGMILISHDIDVLKPYIAPLSDEQWSMLASRWPGPYTFVVPKSERVPDWISGTHDSIAVRVTAHPVAAALCRAFNKPIVSTSANRSTEPPCLDNLEVYSVFGDAVDYILPGRVGSEKKPTTMIDLLSGKILRA